MHPDDEKTEANELDVALEATIRDRKDLLARAREAHRAAEIRLTVAQREFEEAQAAWNAIKELRERNQVIKSVPLQGRVIKGKDEPFQSHTEFQFDD